METNQSSQNDVLSFSFKDATGPEVEAPSRFARALKRARFRKRWTQVKLAQELGISKRTLISWETAARVPSIGMVIVLLDVLSGNRSSLHHELLYAYIVDDLEHQLQRNSSEGRQESPFAHRLLRLISQIEQTAVASEQSSNTGVQEAADQKDKPEEPEIHSSDEQSLEPLFALLNQLHQHPELIAVARDFIQELVPG